MTKLNQIPAVIVGRDFFQDYKYGMDNSSENGANLKKTEFYNPQTLKRNHFLHVWGCISSSPFENAVVFVKDTPAVTGVTVSPAQSTVSASIGKAQLSAKVNTTGFANQAVVWSITKGAEQGAKVDQNGLVTFPTTFTPAQNAIEVTATSVFDSTKKGTASITVVA